MADLNEVRLIGRLTRDPELRSTPSGTSVCSFGLATGRKYKTQSGEMQEETTFVDITAWGKLADIVAQYLRKGSPVFVGGRLKFDSWEDKQSGQRRSKLAVVADNVQFLETKAQAQSGNNFSRQGNNFSQPPAAVTIGMNSRPCEDPELGDPPF